MLAWVLKEASGGTSEKDEDLMGKGLLGKKKTTDATRYNGILQRPLFRLKKQQRTQPTWCLPCLIEIVEKPGEKPYLLYREDNSKKYPGGLKGRKTIPKTVIHHSNTDNPDRCFVSLFKQYRQLCPGDPVAMFSNF